MSESDIRMRVVNLALGNPELVDALEAFQQMYEEKLAAARGTALEEAKAICLQYARAMDAAAVNQPLRSAVIDAKGSMADMLASRIGFLINDSHAPRYLSESAVREALLKHRPVACQDGPERWYLVRGIADALGVELDATPEQDPIPCPERHMSGMSCALPTGHASKHRGRSGALIRTWGPASAPDPTPIADGNPSGENSNHG